MTKYPRQLVPCLIGIKESIGYRLEQSLQLRTRVLVALAGPSHPPVLLKERGKSPLEIFNLFQSSSWLIAYSIYWEAAMVRYRPKLSTITLHPTIQKLKLIILIVVRMDFASMI
jgi:hypothetical protein